MKLSDRLKQWRTRNNLIQKEAAAILGISPCTYRNWEHRPAEPATKKIVEAFLQQYDKEHPVV